jgi:hypothetical protein
LFLRERQERLSVNESPSAVCVCSLVLYGHIQSDGDERKTENSAAIIHKSRFFLINVDSGGKEFVFALMRISGRKSERDSFILHVYSFGSITEMFPKKK